MSKYQHFLLTRFNIPFIRKENIDYLFSPTYLEERFRIFHETCFASIQQQSCLDFTWLVFYDDRTPFEFKSQTKMWHDEFPQFVPVYVNVEKMLQERVYEPYFENACAVIDLKNYPKGVSRIEELNYHDAISEVFFPAHINKLIKTQCENDIQHVITTRIDNDDCFHSCMIEEVQRKCVSIPDETLLSFDNGLQYMYNSHLCQTFYYPNNHFTTLLESASHPLLTVFYWDHFFVDQFKKVEHICNSQPMWLEIVHGTNAINTLKLSKRNNLCWYVSLEKFGIHKKWYTINTLSDLVFRPNLYLWPWLKWRLKLRMVLSSIHMKRR